MQLLEQGKQRKQAEGQGVAAVAVQGTSAGAGTWAVGEGHIECRALRVRYRHDLPLVLRGVDLNLPGGAKIGIVGRTGSGKSTLGLALLKAQIRLNMVTC